MRRDPETYANYVSISTVHGPFEEAQICSFLQSNGIPARVRGEAIRKTHGITMNGIGAAEIEVPAQFAYEARQLLAMAERGDLELADGSGEEAVDAGEDSSGSGDDASDAGEGNRR